MTGVWRGSTTTSRSPTPRRRECRARRQPSARNRGGSGRGRGRLHSHSGRVLRHYAAQAEQVADADEAALGSEQFAGDEFAHQPGHDLARRAQVVGELLLSHAQRAVGRGVRRRYRGVAAAQERMRCATD